MYLQLLGAGDYVFRQSCLAVGRYRSKLTSWHKQEERWDEVEPKIAWHYCRPQVKQMTPLLEKNTRRGAVRACNPQESKWVPWVLAAAPSSWSHSTPSRVSFQTRSLQMAAVLVMPSLPMSLLLAKIPIQTLPKMVEILSLCLAGSVSSAVCGLICSRECIYQHS